MNTEEMPRRRVNFRIDDRVLDALEELAGEGKLNQFVEGLLFDFLKNTGRLPADTPKLPEARGGKRPRAGRKSKPATEESDQPVPPKEAEE